jgi:hypothetical protein
MQTSNVRADLIRAFMAYDHKQSAKPGYNIYAMPQYLRSTEVIADRVDAGEDLRAVLLESLSGRLLGAILRSLRLPSATAGEWR